MNVQEQIEELRTQRAAQWLQLLREGDEEARAGFTRWVGESPLNLEEFLKLEALSRETQAVFRSAAFDRAALLKNLTPQVVELRRSASRTNKHNASRPAWIRITGMAAAISGIALAALLTYDRITWDRYSTEAGQQQTIRLEDGSVVYLNAGSTLAVRLGDDQRELRLSQGEALFDVAQDKRRPFRVSTRDAMVEVLGTQFNVNTRTGGTRVAVVEGRVKVVRGQDTQIQDETALNAGEAARVTPQSIERDSSVNVIAAVAWSQPELVFKSTSLEEAVKQFNRHRRSKPLRLEGVPMGSHHYTGIFNATDAESFSALLARERDLDVQITPAEIIIRQRAETPL